MATGRQNNVMSDEIVTNKCFVCAKKNKRTEADKYCVECKDYYCKSCADIHRIIPAMDRHELLDKRSFKSFRNDGLLPCLPTQRCSIHSSKVVDMFCKDHDEVACATCIALSHRSCEHIYSIPEHVDDLYKEPNLNKLKQMINATEGHMEAIKNSIAAQIEELKTSLDKSLDSVKSFKQDLQYLLDNIEKETINKLKTTFATIKTTLKEELKEAEDMLDALKNMASQLEIAEGNKAQEFVSTKSCTKLTEKAETKIQNRNAHKSISFYGDQSIKSYIRQLSLFGTITGGDDRIDSPTDIDKFQSENRIRKISYQREIDVELPGEGEGGYIIGSCLTEDGYLLLADYQNKKLKLVDMSTETVTDFLNLINFPRAVCTINQNTAAVSLYEQTVQLLSLRNKMAVTSTLRFQHNCEGIAYHNGKLFISDWGCTVYIHDINGQELREIDTDYSGARIFETSLNITVAPEGDRVFVIDRSKGLITLDGCGNYVSTLSESEMMYVLRPQGVCADARDVFVCSSGSNNIVQIGPDNTCIRQIGICANPRSLCFDSQKQRLYVTKHGSNTVTVMQLKCTDRDNRIFGFRLKV